MYRQTSRSDGRTAFGAKHLSKQLLLPISRQAANDVSLRNHLALAVCRQGKGNPYLMNELIQTVYTVYFVQRSGFGSAAVELYRQAEAGLEHARAQAQLSEIWNLDAETAELFEDVLALYDQQLISAPSWMFVEAWERLAVFVAGESHSPFIS